MSEPGTQAFARICRTVVDPANRERFDRADGWLYRAAGHLRDPREADGYVARLRRLLRPVWRRRRQLRFVDVGCGFGLTVVALALLGARRAEGIEASPECLRTCREIAQSFPDVPLEFHEARAEALPLEDRSVDVVCAVEAVSHFIEPWRFLDEAWRVLAPGGLIVIADDNNVANPAQRRALEEVWERFENGPPTDDIHGHRVREPYVVRRREILGRHFPSATEVELEQLSLGTSGLWGERLLEAGRRYFETREMCTAFYRRGTCAVEPTAGAFIENPVDPLEIGRRLRDKGARVDVRPYFGGETRGGIVRAADTLLRTVLPRGQALRFAAGFRVYARKPASP